MDPMLSPGPNFACQSKPIQCYWSSVKDRRLHSSCRFHVDGHTWVLLSGRPINFNKVKTIPSIPLFPTMPCLIKIDASIQVAKGQLLFSSLSHKSAFLD